MPKTDLRVMRTHKLIKNALLELLKTQPFDEIAVADIIENAMVNRTTFYKYYSGKSDLAAAMIDEFKQNLQQMLHARIESGETQEFFVQAPLFLYEHRHLLLALWQVRTKRLHLYDDMHAMIKRNFIRHADKIHGAGDWDYPAQLFATLSLDSMKYMFEHETLMQGDTVLEKWTQMIELAKRSNEAV